MMGLIRAIVFVIAALRSADAGRILLMPYDHKAHAVFYSILGKELQSRGHHVDMLVAARSAEIPRKAGIGVIVVEFEEYSNFASLTNLSLSEQQQYGVRILNAHFRRVMSDVTLIERVRQQAYDLCVIDALHPNLPMYLLPYKLDIRIVSLHVLVTPWNVRVPALPSVEGFIGFFDFFEVATFYDRLTNTLFYILSQLMYTFPHWSLGVHDSYFDEFAPEKPNIGFDKLFRQSEIHLVAQDPICTDQHRVSAPHYQYIGGIGVQDGKPLPEKLQKFMDSATDGAIIVSMGSGIETIPDGILDKMLDAFADLKQRVVIRHSGKTPRKPSSNVLVQTWLPQNDLVAHERTLIFVTHCGNFGQLEAVHHGVPMLMLPLRFEQRYNAARASRRNYGLTLDPWSFTSEEMRNAINELIENPKYRQNIGKCSAIQHSMPLPKDTAAFWIEHALRFGGDHLRPYYIDMPLWKFFLLDVIMFLAIMALICLYCSQRIARFVFDRTFSRKFTSACAS